MFLRCNQVANPFIIFVALSPFSVVEWSFLIILTKAGVRFLLSKTNCSQQKVLRWYTLQKITENWAGREKLKRCRRLNL